MSPQAITTDQAPAAIGPYSQAVKSGNLLFVSGQLPIDPATGELLKGDIQAQTARVIQNITAILEAAGSNLDKVVKTEVYLADINNFAAVNETYATFFSQSKPARQAMQVAALPKGAAIEISCIAEV
jgi:2-iminobutanoate/2-iminopropanoate deaminase